MPKLPTDVQRAINQQAPKLLKKDFNKDFKKKFEEIKEEMINEFLNHPVTIEINAGPSSANISGTLGGVSNLFAFIGFNIGDKPTKPILDILQNIKYRDAGDSKAGAGIDFIVDIPTPEDIFAVTPMPWATGRSWAKGIESGISGLGYLLNKRGKSSRSGVAIQAENKVRGSRFRNTAYISSFLKKYEKKFKNLK